MECSWTFNSQMVTKRKELSSARGSNNVLRNGTKKTIEDNAKEQFTSIIKKYTRATHLLDKLSFPSFLQINQIGFISNGILPQRNSASNGEIPLQKNGRINGRTLPERQHRVNGKILPQKMKFVCNGSPADKPTRLNGKLLPEKQNCLNGKVLPDKQQRINGKVFPDKHVHLNGKIPDQSTLMCDKSDLPKPYDKVDGKVSPEKTSPKKSNNVLGTQNDINKCNGDQECSNGHGNSILKPPGDNKSPHKTAKGKTILKKKRVSFGPPTVKIFSELDYFTGEKLFIKAAARRELPRNIKKALRVKNNKVNVIVTGKRSSFTSASSQIQVQLKPRIYKNNHRKISAKHAKGNLDAINIHLKVTKPDNVSEVTSNHSNDVLDQKSTQPEIHLKVTKPDNVSEVTPNNSNEVRDQKSTLPEIHFEVTKPDNVSEITPNNSNGVLDQMSTQPETQTLEINGNDTESLKTSSKTFSYSSEKKCKKKIIQSVHSPQIRKQRSTQLAILLKGSRKNGFISRKRVMSRRILSLQNGKTRNQSCSKTRIFCQEYKARTIRDKRFKRNIIAAGGKSSVKSTNCVERNKSEKQVTDKIHIKETTQANGSELNIEKLSKIQDQISSKPETSLNIPKTNAMESLKKDSKDSIKPPKSTKRHINDIPKLKKNERNKSEKQVTDEIHMKVTTEANGSKVNLEDSSKLQVQISPKSETSLIIPKTNASESRKKDNKDSIKPPKSTKIYNITKLKKKEGQNLEASIKVTNDQSIEPKKVQPIHSTEIKNDLKSKCGIVHELSKKNDIDNVKDVISSRVQPIPKTKNSHQSSSKTRTLLNEYKSLSINDKKVTNNIIFADKRSSFKSANSNIKAQLISASPKKGSKMSAHHVKGKDSGKPVTNESHLNVTNEGSGTNVDQISLKPVSICNQMKTDVSESSKTNKLLQSTKNPQTIKIKNDYPSLKRISRRNQGKSLEKALFNALGTKKTSSIKSMKSNIKIRSKASAQGKQCQKISGNLGGVAKRKTACNTVNQAVLTSLNASKSGKQIKKGNENSMKSQKTSNRTPTKSLQPSKKDNVILKKSNCKKLKRLGKVNKTSPCSKVPASYCSKLNKKNSREGTNLSIKNSTSKKMTSRKPSTETFKKSAATPTKKADKSGKVTLSKKCMRPLKKPKTVSSVKSTSKARTTLQNKVSNVKKLSEKNSQLRFKSKSKNLETSKKVSANLNKNTKQKNVIKKNKVHYDKLKKKGILQSYERKNAPKMKTVSNSLLSRTSPSSSAKKIQSSMKGTSSSKIDKTNQLSVPYTVKKRRKSYFSSLKKRKNWYAYYINQANLSKNNKRRSN